MRSIKIGIDAGVAAGRLQIYIKYNMYNELKTKYTIE